MQNIKKIPLIAIIIMVILSFSNFLGVNIAGISVYIGIIFFFINRAIEKQPFRGSGLDIKAISTSLKYPKVWLLLAMPLIMDAVSISIAVLFLPEYIGYEISRAEAFVSFDKGILSVLQLAVLALGEEIAWRAFFQKQLNKVLEIIPVLIASSILFAFGHFARGNVIVVIYNIFFVFINSVLYGVIFHRTNNAWVSAISHFIANLFSVVVILFISI